MELNDFQNMASIMTGIKSQFILSINDHPDIRDVFGSFEIKPVSLNYTVARGKQTKGREFIITNF
jgi:DNA adenine methylase